MKRSTYTTKEAKSNGYRPLTIEYRIPAENRMLDAVLSDMAAGNVDAILVKRPYGVEVWRRAPKSQS